MIGLNEGRYCDVGCLGCCNLGQEGIVWGDQDGGGNEVRSMMKGMGGRSGENGKGGGGREMVVWSAGEGIWLSVGCALSVDDFVVVGGEGGCPSGMSSGCSSGLGEV